MRRQARCSITGLSGVGKSTRGLVVEEDSMRCLFCKAGTSASKSIEHIIPESLGNTRHVLRRGIVCDGCNNYFSREVERPFMESEAIKTLRFHQALQSKKGRVPPIAGVVYPDIPVSVTRHLDPYGTSVAIPPEAFDRIAQASKGTLILPISFPLPAGAVVSRFLAKVALESMAARLSEFPEGLDYLCDEAQLDTLRNHARRGTTAPWPVHTRRIYDANGKTFCPEGWAQQVVHESDFLVTPTGEWYFILAVFGEEFAINLGGPETEGYVQWLKDNNNESPLYSGKNRSGYAMPVTSNEWPTASMRPIK
jgi:hypothetical protein